MNAGGEVRHLPAESCRHLRFKAMYTEGKRAKILDTTVFWCVKTCMSLGPDRLPASEFQCLPGRRCYEPEA